MINFLKGLFGIWTTLIGLMTVYGIVAYPLDDLLIRLAAQVGLWAVPVALVGGVVWLVRAGKRAAERSRRLIPCRMCGHQIAGNTMTCPSCGTETPSGPAIARRLINITLWTALGAAVMYAIYKSAGDAGDALIRFGQGG